jgi:hypothetical protein
MEKCNSLATHKPNAHEDQIELHFMGKHDVDFDTTISRLFIDEETSYVFIDVAVHPKRNGWFFMVVSGHEPAPIEKVYDCDGLGPFKALVPA